MLHFLWIGGVLGLASAAVRRMLRDRPGSLLEKYSKAIGGLIMTPQGSSTLVRLYRIMEEAEAKLLLKHINSRKDVSAWY